MAGIEVNRLTDPNTAVTFDDAAGEFRFERDGLLQRTAQSEMTIGEIDSGTGDTTGFTWQYDSGNNTAVFKDDGDNIVFEVGTGGAKVSGLEAPGSDGELVFNQNGSFSTDSDISYDQSSGSLLIEGNDKSISNGVPGVFDGFFDPITKLQFPFEDITEKSEIPTSAGLPSINTLSAGLTFKPTLDEDYSTINTSFFYPISSESRFEPNNSQNFVDFGNTEINALGYTDFTIFENIQGTNFLGGSMGPVTYTRGANLDIEGDDDAAVQVVDSTYRAQHDGRVEEVAVFSAEAVFDSGFSGDIETLSQAKVYDDGFENSGISVDRFYGFRQIGKNQHNTFENTLSVGGDVDDTFNPGSVFIAKGSATAPTSLLEVQDSRGNALQKTFLGVSSISEAPTLSKTEASSGNLDGSTSIDYAVVARDPDGNRTLRSPIATIDSVDPTALDSSNFITVDWQAAQGNIGDYVVLKDEGQTGSFAQVGTPVPSGTTTFDDTGQGTSSFAQPSQNETSKTESQSDVEVLEPGDGLILTSPDGTQTKRVFLDNSGNLATETV